MDTTRTGPIFLLGHPASATVPVAIFQGIVTLLVQAIYIHRIVRLTKGMSKFHSLRRPARIVTYTLLWIAGGLMIASLVGFVMFSKVSAKPIPDWFPELRIFGILALTGASAVDAILCSCMVYHLQQHKGQSDFQQTNMTATRYIKLTLETGLIPTIGQIIELFLIVTKPKTGIWAGFGYPLAKVYVIAVLVLYEAALSGDRGFSSHSHERNKQSSGEIPGRRLHGILVTETSSRREDVIEQPVLLKNMPPPSSRFEVSEKNVQFVESMES
ncbi:hypothetical protein BT69DRAFT_1287319 [Atractiella rhizophila]|nr:hypothetical protein BT69DRAFT_1287319 [Atractiella rhizophila]